MKKDKKKPKKVPFLVAPKKLRKIMGLKQSDVKGFEQAGVSKIESRDDIKLSTLVKYVTAINMDLEIKAIAREESEETPKEVVLLSTAKGPKTGGPETEDKKSS